MEYADLPASSSHQHLSTDILYMFNTIGCCVQALSIALSVDVDASLPQCLGTSVSTLMSQYIVTLAYQACQLQ